MIVRLAITAMCVAAWVASGWWVVGGSWRPETVFRGPNSEPAGTTHVWICRGRIEIFAVPFGACGYIPPDGLIFDGAELAFDCAGELGNYMIDDGERVSIPWYARWRMGFDGSIRGPIATLPMWAPVGVLLLWCATPIARRRRRGTCSDCGYSLAGLPDAACCPECGAVIDDARRAQAPVNQPLS